MRMRRLTKAWTEAWTPKPKMPIAEWATSRFQLSRQVEANGGAYNLRDYPYMIEIAEAFEDPDVEKLSIVASTQVGKTLFVQVALGWVSSQDPAPAMICLPDQSSATEFRDRFYANMIESPEMRRRVPPQSKWNTRHIDLTTSRIYLAWSGSRQRLRGRPCRYVVLSEVDVYQHTMAGDPVRIAEERTKKFFRKKIVQESTPVGESSVICAEYEAGDKRRWHGQCPECGRWQELRFFVHTKGEFKGRGGLAGFRGEDGEMLPVDDARATAHYLCESGCEIYDDRKRALVVSGRWVRDGENVDEHGNIVGTPKRSNRHASFRLWAIHSHTVSLADIAEAFIIHTDGGQIAEFWENWLGRKYSTARHVPKWQQVGRKLRGDHKRGEVPEAAWFLTCGVDVQEDGLYWVVRAWAPRVQSWLVDWGFIDRHIDDEREGEVASDLGRLSELLSRKWPIVDGEKNPLGVDKLGVKLMCVDANYRTAQVRQWQSDVKTSRVRAIMGDVQSVKPADRFRRSRIERTRDKESTTRGMVIWRVNVNVYKEDLMARIVAGCEGSDGSFLLTSDVLRHGAAYLKQLVNEEKRREVDRNGRPRFVWVVRSVSLGNHHWDDEIYCRAGADMVLADLRLDWNSGDWPKPGDGLDAPVEMLDRTARE
jgi:phage terminase large subunit GpA-like protein